MNDIISNLYESWFSKGYPQDWKISRIKDLISLIRKEKNKSEETPVISLTINGVKLKNNLSEGMNPETYIGHQLVYPGDLVICLRDLDGPLLVGISEHYGCTSNLYVILQIANQNIEYYNHVFKTMDFLRVIDDFSYGMRHSYNISQFGQLRLPVPQRYIQDRIVKELNTLEVKINQLINNQQQQIEKLKEYKQSLISEAVTKGLNPNVEFKDSGVEWIGKIPKDAQLVQFKRLAIINNGKEIVNVDGEIPVYGSGGIFKYTDDYLFQGESILYGRKGTIDKPLHVNGKFWTVDTMFYTEISELVIPRYLYYVSIGSINFDYYKSGSVLPSMTQFELGNVLLPFFDKKSQEKIIEYLDYKTSLLDKVIEQKSSKIKKLEEFKKSLIYEYVTGKRIV